MADKFDDCRYCNNRRTELCDECEVGENFEDIDEGLDFDDVLKEAA